MMDTYQAIYDATRASLRNCDVGAAIKAACSIDVSHPVACLQQEFSLAAYQMARPAAIWRPALSIDGNKWCALYGNNLQDGVAGFGDSPSDAMDDFDRNWNAKLTATAPLYPPTTLGDAIGERFSPTQGDKS